MKIGKYELFALETGRFTLDGGSMFGVVPKTIWEKTNPADDQNRIELAMRVLLIKGPDTAILVDTGIGHRLDEKFKDIFEIRNSDFLWDQALNKFGLLSQDITHIIISHLHFDHAGGSTCVQDGKIVPTFPNATYFVQERQYKWALAPSVRDRASFRKDDFEPLAAAGQLKLMEGGYELRDGIEVFLSEGHTPAQQLVKISDGKNVLVYCADMIPTSSHVPVPYVMGYDNQPVVTAVEKESFLKKAVKGKWILFFEHDPYIMAAYSSETKRGFIKGESIIL